MQQWLDNSWIRRIEPTSRDVADLLAVAQREIADGSLRGMSADGTFDHAYAAVRALCQAALHASGFAVSKGSRSHERLIESLKFTLDEEWSAEIDHLDRCRRMRHQALYDRAGVVRQTDAAELLEVAQRLQGAVHQWLERHHSHLLQEA